MTDDADTKRCNVCHADELRRMQDGIDTLRTIIAHCHARELTLLEERDAARAVLAAADAMRQAMVTDSACETVSLPTSATVPYDLAMTALDAKVD